MAKKIFGVNQQNQTKQKTFSAQLGFNLHFTTATDSFPEEVVI